MASLNGFDGVVALDGPSGTGKSTVARGLARRLGARYLDTGAMYRAATLAVLRSGTALDDPDGITQVVRAARIVVSTDPDAPAVELDGDAVSQEIRGPQVTQAVSAVSAVPEVRELLVAAQRALIEQGPVVAEGRDIGSVVWPSARPKVYLTASAEARARRRAGETAGSDRQGRDEQELVAAVAADIDRRDRLDSTRAASPLTRAGDAVEVDTTELGIDEVIDLLAGLATNDASSAHADAPTPTPAPAPTPTPTPQQGPS